MTELFAYLDPNTGSLIFQCLAAIVVGAFFTIKLYWLKARAFFSSLFGGKKQNESDNKMVAGNIDQNDKMAA